MEEDASSSANVPPASLKRSFSELALDNSPHDTRPGSSSSATLNIMNRQTSPRRSTPSASPRPSDRRKSDASRRSIGAGASSRHPSESPEDGQGRYKRARSASFDESSQNASGGSDPPPPWTDTVLPVRAESARSPSDNRAAGSSSEREEEGAVDADVIVISDGEEEFMSWSPSTRASSGDGAEVDARPRYPSSVSGSPSDQGPPAAGPSRVQLERPDRPPSEERVAPEVPASYSPDWLSVNTRSTEANAASSARSNSSLDSQTTRATAGDLFDELLPMSEDDISSTAERWMNLEPPWRSRTLSERPNAGTGRITPSTISSSSSRLPIGPEPTTRVSQSYLHATRLERERLLRARASSPASTTATRSGPRTRVSSLTGIEGAYPPGLLSYARRPETSHADSAVHMGGYNRTHDVQDRLDRSRALIDAAAEPVQIRSIMDRVGDVRQSTERLNRTINEIREAMADMADIAEYPQDLLDSVDTPPGLGQSTQEPQSEPAPGLDSPSLADHRPSTPAAAAGSRHPLPSPAENRSDRHRPPTWLLAAGQAELARARSEPQQPSSSRPPSQASSRSYLRLAPPTRSQIPTNVPPSSAVPTPVASSPLRHTYVPEPQGTLHYHRSDTTRQNNRFPFRDSVPSEPSVTDLHLARAMSHIDPMREALEDLITTGTAAPEVVQAALNLVEASHTLEQTVSRDRRAAVEAEETEWTRVRRQREHIQRTLHEYSPYPGFEFVAREDSPSLFFPSREPVRQDRSTDNRIPDSTLGFGQPSYPLGQPLISGRPTVEPEETEWTRERRHRETIERALNEYSHSSGFPSSMMMHEHNPTPSYPSRLPTLHNRPSNDRFPATEVWQDLSGVTREQPLYTPASPSSPWRYPHEPQDIQPAVLLSETNFVPAPGPFIHHIVPNPAPPTDDDMEVEVLLDALTSSTPPSTAEAPPRASVRRHHSMHGAAARAPPEPSSSGRDASGTHQGASRTIDLNAYHQGPMRSALARSVELDRRRAQLAEMRRTQSTRRPAHSGTVSATTPSSGSLNSRSAEASQLLQRLVDVAPASASGEESLRSMSRFSDSRRPLRRDPTTGQPSFSDRVTALARARGDSWRLWPGEEILFDVYHHLPSRRGVPQSVVDSLPNGTYSEWATPGETEARCPICFEDYSPTDPLLRLPVCSHWFHKPCLLQWLKTSNTCPMCRAHVSNPPAPGDRSSSRLRTSRISRPVELQELLYDPPPRRTRSTVTFSRHRSTPGPGLSSSSAAPAPAATSTDSAAQPQVSAAAQRTYAHALSRAVASLQEPSPPPLPVTPSSSNVPPPLRSPGTPPRFIWYDAIPARRNARHGQSSDQNQGQQSQQTREGDANGERRPERRDERGPGEGGSGRERQPSVD